MKSSETINELAAALSKAQAGFTSPSRNREVSVKLKDGKGEYKFKYATLDTIMDMIRKPLADNGLSIVHALDNDSEGTICETRLIHSSGQWCSTWVPVIVGESANAQGWGSAITYAKRYGVTTLLGIAADEDDDGNAACGNHATATERPKRGTPPKAPEPPKPEAPKTAPPTDKPVEWTLEQKLDWFKAKGVMIHAKDNIRERYEEICKLSEQLSKRSDIPDADKQSLIEQWGEWIVEMDQAAIAGAPG